MRLFEFETSLDTQKLVALGEFLLARATDTDAQKKISVATFLQLANSQGISLSQDQLTTMAQQPPLSNIIQDIQDNEIVFKGSEEPAPNMTVDQAQQTVDRMAKRASAKASKSL
jgi:hypothetical protein